MDMGWTIFTSLCNVWHLGFLFGSNALLQPQLCRYPALLLRLLVKPSSVGMEAHRARAVFPT